MFLVHIDLGSHEGDEDGRIMLAKIVLVDARGVESELRSESGVRKTGIIFSYRVWSDIRLLT
jgi:hypothetical protein